MQIAASGLKYRREGERFVIFESDTVCDGLGERAIAVTAGSYAASEDAARLLANSATYRDELRAAIGYLLNAKIDLESGCTKTTAIKTIEGGIKRFRAVLDAAQ